MPDRERNSRRKITNQIFVSKDLQFYECARGIREKKKQKKEGTLFLMPRGGTRRGEQEVGQKPPAHFKKQPKRKKSEFVDVRGRSRFNPRGSLPRR